MKIETPEKCDVCFDNKHKIKVLVVVLEVDN